MLLLVVAAVCGGFSHAYAQGGRQSDGVLYPQPDPPPLMFGPEIGYGWWENKGSFMVPDGNRACSEFTDGSGEGITYGAKGMIYLNSWFFISPRVRFEARSGTFMADLPGEPVRDRTNEIVTLEQEGQVDATMAAVAADLTVGVEFFRTGIYLFGGGSASFLLDGFYDYSERVKGPTGFTYADTRSITHKLVSGYSFPGYENTTFDLRGGLGYVLRLEPFAFNPEVFYSYPLTSALAKPDELKQTGIIGTFGVLYMF